MGSIKNATRPFFAASEKPGQVFYEECASFDWHSGMSWQVRQRSSESFAEAILAKYGAGGLKGDEILEVSTASKNYAVGKALSAVNLLYKDDAGGLCYSVENWFQAAKVFEKDGIVSGPYPELLEVRMPKRYLNSSISKDVANQYRNDPLFNRIQKETYKAPLIRFEMLGSCYPMVPRSCFYDYLYVSALNQEKNASLAESIMQYRVFTDIMFTPGSGSKRKYNTQARSCAIFVSLRKRQAVDAATRDIQSFIEAVGYQESQQSTLL